MFSLSSTFRYYFYNSATDMRKGFDGLCGLVHTEIGRRPVSGEVFIFVYLQREKIKMLHWKQGGFVLYYKRLERGTFEFAKDQFPGQNLPDQLVITDAYGRGYFY